MSTDLTLSVRFPTGRFSGASNGTTEWPPSPARLAAALLSAAGNQGRPVVAALFAADPPTIDVPPGVPTLGAGRWVPTQHTVTVNAKGKGTLARDGKKQTADSLDRKEAAPGLPSVHVGDNDITYLWTGLGHLAEELRPVAQRVPYLGRPTTPAVLNVTTSEGGFGPVRPGHVRLVPDPGGSRQIGVPSTAYLESLDAVHDSRIQNRTIGFDQPVKTRRTFAAYRTVKPPAPTGIGLAPRSEALAWVGKQILYRVADRAVILAGDIRFCTDAVADALKASEVIPVLWGYGDAADGRLRAVIVCDPTVPELQVSIEVPTRTGMVRLEYSPAGAVAEAGREAWMAERLLARSPLWTTLTPVSLGVDEAATLHSAQAALEGVAGEPVVGFATHPEPRGAWQPYFPERLSSTHVSVQLADSVHGPLLLQIGETRTALIPANPGTHDDDPRRGTLL